MSPSTAPCTHYGLPIALQQLNNVFACDASDEEQRSPACRFSGKALRRRALSLHPAADLLVSPHGLLHSLAADLKTSGKRPRTEASDPPPMEESALRCMQCAGTLLSSCSDAEAATLAAAAWQAVTPVAAMLAELSFELQEALLHLMSCLALRTTTILNPSLPENQLWSLALDSVRWMRAVKGSEAAPQGAALLGQVLLLLQTHADKGSSSELGRQLLDELRATTAMRNPLAAVEALAALSEAGALDADIRERMPALRAKLSSRLEQGDDRAATALELLDAVDADDST